jgi:hypothetical protein
MSHVGMKILPNPLSKTPIGLCNLEAGYLIYIFAILCKVHFSFKKWKKSILKTNSTNCFCSRTSERALPRRHARPRRRSAVRVVPTSGAHAEVLE